MAAERPHSVIKRGAYEFAEFSKKVDKISIVAGAGFYLIGVGGIAAILIGGTIITYPLAKAVENWSKQ